MAKKNNTTLKRSARADTKVGCLARKDDMVSNSSQHSDSKGHTITKMRGNMTLEELSLRAYKMTYERLHESKKTRK